MKTILTEEWVEIPEGGKLIYCLFHNVMYLINILVTLTTKARRVTVKGPKG